MGEDCRGSIQLSGAPLAAPPSQHNQDLHISILCCHRAISPTVSLSASLYSDAAINIHGYCWYSEQIINTNNICHTRSTITDKYCSGSVMRVNSQNRDSKNTIPNLVKSINVHKENIVGKGMYTIFYCTTLPDPFTKFISLIFVQNVLISRKHIFLI